MGYLDLYSKFCSTRLRADARSGAVAVAGYFDG